MSDRTPRRLAPNPRGEDNVPALAALFMGPLSILLLASSTSAFFVSLPCAVGAIVLGTIGRRGHTHVGLARLGRAVGVLGAVLSVLALLAFIAVSVALDATGDGLGRILDAARDAR